jgi:hypothetical protein
VRPEEADLLEAGTQEELIVTMPEAVEAVMRVPVVSGLVRLVA